MRVVCAVLFKSDKVFLAQRSPLMRHPGKWEFPGGKIAPGESETAAIKREIKEEFNIDLEVIKMMKPVFSREGNIEIELIPVLIKTAEKNIIPMEHSQCGWFTKGEVSNMDLLKGDLLIFKNLKEELWL